MRQWHRSFRSILVLLWVLVALAGFARQADACASFFCADINTCPCQFPLWITSSQGTRCCQDGCTPDTRGTIWSYIVYYGCCNCSWPYQLTCSFTDYLDRVGGYCECGEG